MLGKNNTANNIGASFNREAIIESCLGFFMAIKKNPAPVGAEAIGENARSAGQPRPLPDCRISGP